MQRRLLACPKCGGTYFNVHLVTVDKFFYPISSKPLVFIMHECATCGWKSHPDNESELKQMLIEILKGRVPEGFVFANE